MASLSRSSVLEMALGVFFYAIVTGIDAGFSPGKLYVVIIPFPLGFQLSLSVVVNIFSPLKKTVTCHQYPSKAIAYNECKYEI